MTESLTVDPVRLAAAGAALRELSFPDAPSPIDATGTDSISMAIGETMPIIESPVMEGLPAVKDAVMRSGSNIVAAARAYTDADRRLGTFVGAGQHVGDAVAGPRDSLAGAANTPGAGLAVGPASAAQPGQTAAQTGQVAVVAASAAQGLQQGVQVVMQGVQQVAGSASRGGGTPAHLAAQGRSVDEAPATDRGGPLETSADGAAPGDQTQEGVPLQPPTAGRPATTSSGVEV